MGIFSPMTDIINSNLNSLLDSAEDPSKMIRLIIQEMEDALVEVRSSSARVLADRKAARRRAQHCHEDMEGWQDKARLAVTQGREDLAKAALHEKQLLLDEVAAVEVELLALDDAFAKFERYERRMEHLESQVEAMDIGRSDKPDLATEIEALAEDEKLNEDLARLKAEMAAAKAE